MSPRAQFVADLNKQIAADYDVLLDGGIALRGLSGQLAAG
jgi:hypothetical protein